MKNIEQTTQFPAFSIISEKIDGVNLSDKAKEGLASVGAESPNDLVNVTMTLGSFLFDIYICHTKAPEAPLNLYLHNKKLAEFATDLSKGELVVPKEVLDVVKDVLSDKNKWESTNFATFTMVNGHKKTIGMKAAGASYFNQILTAAIEACLAV